MALIVHLEHSGRLLSQRAFPLAQETQDRDLVVLPALRDRQWYPCLFSVDYNTTLLVQIRRHQVISGGSTTHACRTVCCTARTAERIAHLRYTFRN
jgi:hypothetical protein